MMNVAKNGSYIPIHEHGAQKRWAHFMDKWGKTKDTY